MLPEVQGEILENTRKEREKKECRVKPIPTARGESKKYYMGVTEKKILGGQCEIFLINFPLN